MKQTFQELIVYLRNPTLGEDTNNNFHYRIKKLGQLLLICLATGIVISPIFGLLEEFGLINLENHAMEEMMKNLSKPMIFITAVIVAPLFEELIFRAPLTLFKSQKSFKIGFYAFALIFGLIHITNFTITKNVLLLTPILVLPQILLGGYLGYIRVRFGLGWSMALHASYNGILMLITFSSDLF